MKTMPILLKRILALSGIALFSVCANASVPNTNSHPTTFLGPSAKGAFTTTINSDTAYSVAAEVGVKNFRAGGTVGWELQANQRLKLSAEYLWQKLNYSFFAGNTQQWVKQGALGVDYQYDLGFTYNPQFDLRSYLAYAPNKSLHSLSGTFINNAGVSQAFMDNRQIAGSSAFGLSPGITIEPWIGTKVGANANYDNVRYDKKHSPNQDAKGFGVTVHLDQALSEDVNLGLLASVRQPYNNYQASLAWANAPYMGDWIIGIDGAYTSGKNTLPSSYNVGLTASYAFDQRCDKGKPARYKGMKAAVDVRVHDNLLAWTATPAGHMPEVLAVPDEKVLGG